MVIKIMPSCIAGFRKYDANVANVSHHIIQTGGFSKIATLPYRRCMSVWKLNTSLSVDLQALTEIYCAQLGISCMPKASGFSPPWVSTRRSQSGFTLNPEKKDL